MKRLSLSIIAPLLFLAALAGAVSADVTTPPDNPDDTDRLRVWVPIQKDIRCRVTATVLGHKGKPIRSLVNKLLGKGYHNFYWDKRDDSGQYVDSGQYAVLVSVCGDSRYETLEVVYRPWERTSHLEVVDSDSNSSAVVTLLEDSANVSLVVATAAGDTVSTIVRDTLLTSGSYSFPIKLSNRSAPGSYEVVLFIGGDAIKTESFRYRR